MSIIYVKKTLLFFMSIKIYTVREVGIFPAAHTQSDNCQLFKVAIGSDSLLRL